MRSLLAPQFTVWPFADTAAEQPRARSRRQPAARRRCRAQAPGRVALLLGLLMTVPTAAHAETETESGGQAAVDLAHLRLTEGVYRAPVAGGETAELTLAPEYQRAAERLLALARPLEGAAVVIEARTGRVLVWAEWRREGAPPGSLLLGRQVPAASVFKLVTAAALLEEARVQPSRSVCTIGGEHALDQSHLSPPKRGAAVCGPFSQAVGLSRNAAIAQLAHRFLNPAGLKAFAARLGFGSLVPFDAPIPQGSFAPPDSELGFARAAAGFQDSSLSPLGAAELSYTIARGGRRSPVHIVVSPEGSGGSAHRGGERRVLKPWTARVLTRMMEFTVHSGTSRKAFSDEAGRNLLGDIRVAGKTGTLRANADAPMTSWFTGFAPSRHPELVVAVLLNNGEIWRQKANEVARDLLRYYFAERSARGVTSPFDS